VRNGRINYVEVYLYGTALADDPIVLSYLERSPYHSPPPLTNVAADERRANEH